ncbi:MAG: acyl-CoA thioesterase [Jatrophihabitantaceae bacterium]
MAFEFPVVVPYYQVDQQGVVFNMWYLAWFDEAMSGLLSSVGYPYETMIAGGVDVQLVHTDVDWRGSARWGEQVRIEVSPAAVGTTSFTLAFDARVRGEAIVSARTVYVVIATDGSGKLPVPPALRDALGST